MLAIMSYVWNHTCLVCTTVLCWYVMGSLSAVCPCVEQKTQISPVFFMRSPCTGGYAVGTCAGLRGGWTGWVDRFESAPHQSSSLAIVVWVQLGVQVFFLSEGTSAGIFWTIVNMEEVGEWGENSIWKNRPWAMEVDLLMFDITRTLYICI